MRNRIFALLLFLTCFAFTPTGQAGFWVLKHAKASAAASTPIQMSHAASAYFPRIDTNNRLLPAPYHPERRNSSRWQGSGQIALLLGIMGIILFPFGPFAILFGIIGLRHDKKNHGQALAGLILGCIMTFLYGLLLFVIIFG